MIAVMRLRAALLATSAGACAGGLVLLALGGERASEAAWFVSANAAAAIALPSSMRDIGGDFALCQTTAVAPMTRGMIRLVATQTEVPQARSNAASPALAFADSDPPLWDGLGSLSIQGHHVEPAAQSYFDQGLRLTMPSITRRRSAHSARRRSSIPTAPCASGARRWCSAPTSTCRWWRRRWRPRSPRRRRRARLPAKASPQEQALIAALSKRYADNPKADRAALDAAYAAAMAQAAAQFPDDNEIAVLYAEALMDLSPWDYWQPGGREPNPQSAEIVADAGARARQGPQSSRARSTTTSMPSRRRTAPERAEPYADRLRGAVPGAGHLVHMPSHIYYRVGRYLDALVDNTTAAAVDEKYLAASDAPMGVYRLGYYPHNVHFVMASALMAGDGANSIAAAEKLRGLVPDEAALAIPAHIR